MSYRDDHDAALARAEALEREVAELRAEDASQADRIAYLEESLADARRAAERAQAALAKLQPAHSPAPTPPRPPPPTDSLPSSADKSTTGIVVVVVGMAVILLGLVAAGIHAHDRDRDDHLPLGDEPRPQVVLPATGDDTSRLIAEALNERLAAKLPGGFLEKITITELDEAGAVHPEYGGEFQLQFERREAVPQEAERPIGAPAPPPPANDGYACLVMSRDGGAWTDLDFGLLCHGYITGSHNKVDAPRCTPSSIWKLARADGATAGALASLTYDGAWTFTIDDKRAPFEHRYDDNCTL